MASNIVYTLSLLSCLILFSSLFHTSSSISEPSYPNNKVLVRIYYESIGNAEYFSTVLSKFITGKLLPIINLHLVPWGNAKILTNGSFECEYGKKECFLNTIEACAIDKWFEVEKHFKFILCVEKSVYHSENSDWKTCFDTLRLDPKPIGQCYNSELGKALEVKYASETAVLHPPLEFTPWVLVDRKPIKYDHLNVVSYICKAYKGSSPPKICKKLPLITT